MTNVHGFDSGLGFPIQVGPNRILLWDSTGRDPVEPPTVPGAHVFLICLDPIVAHRAEIAARKAGLEIRDTMVWFRGQQPPVTVVVGRKPLEGTVASNVLKYGIGALNVDACRVWTDDILPKMSGKAILGGSSDGWDRPWKNNPNGLARRQAAADAAIEKAHSLGRWPANVLHDGSAEVLGEFPVTASGAMSKHVPAYAGHSNTPLLRGRSGPNNQHGDHGSAARFFHTIPDLEALVHHLTALVANPGLDTRNPA